MKSSELTALVPCVAPFSIRAGALSVGPSACDRYRWRPLFVALSGARVGRHEQEAVPQLISAARSQSRSCLGVLSL